MNIWLLIPTYNERESLPRIIQAVQRTGLSDLTILIIDDNSPDGTGEIADELSRQTSGIQVLHREKKEGLGPAYVDGIQKALMSGADIVIEMDADGSHDPAVLAAMIEAMKRVDVVVGSRYVKNGGTSDWSRSRRLISQFGNWYARTLLRLPLRDLTSGFVAYQATVLRSLDLTGINSIGYNFQVEMKARCYWAGYAIEEIPIIFHERRDQVSKFSLAIVLESFWQIIRLALRK
jgi:glycosyltransferase involved in cell wall biosynthesis